MKIEIIGSIKGEGGAQIALQLRERADGRLGVFEAGTGADCELSGKTRAEAVLAIREAYKDKEWNLKFRNLSDWR